MPTTMQQSLKSAAKPQNQLVQDFQQQWEEIKPQISDEDSANQFEVLMSAVVSRLTGVYETRWSQPITYTTSGVSASNQPQTQQARTGS